MSNTQEPDDVDERGTSRRIVEVVETPPVTGDGVLFDVGVTVQLNGRQMPDVRGEDVAHARRPLVIDESKVVVRCGPHAFEHLWRRHGQHFGPGLSSGSLHATAATRIPRSARFQQEVAMR